MKQPQTMRYQFLDLTRGVAIILMFIYHLAFGLDQLGFINIELATNISWIIFRAIIVFLFLSLVGVGLYLVSRKGLNKASYFKRLSLLFVYACSITISSYFVRPDYYVFFGILHLIFIASILGLIFLKLKWFNLALGICVFILGIKYSNEFLNHPLTLWIGMHTTSFNTDDYAPLFPWFGFVLMGIFAGKVIFSKDKFINLTSWKSNNWLIRIISWMGRHSIHLYIAHFQFFYLMVYIWS